MTLLPLHPKTRGKYKCGLCGKLKKGHVCDGPIPATAQTSSPPSLFGAANASNARGRKHRHMLPKETLKWKHQDRADEASGGRNTAPLDILTTKFIELAKGAPDGIEVTMAKKILGLRNGRHLYDVTTVLEGQGLMVKRSTKYYWKPITLQADIDTLTLQDRKLDERMSEMRDKLTGLTEDETNQKLFYVTEDDIKYLPCFQNQRLILLKAPPGARSTLTERDPEEVNGYPQRILSIRSNGMISSKIIIPNQRSTQTINMDSLENPRIAVLGPEVS